jgi:hypothetical protein
VLQRLPQKKMRPEGRKNRNRQIFFSDFYYGAVADATGEDSTLSPPVLTAVTTK